MTGGGDAPGLNAVIRAATIAAARNGWEVADVAETIRETMLAEIDKLVATAA